MPKELKKSQRTPNAALLAVAEQHNDNVVAVAKLANDYAEEISAIDSKYKSLLLPAINKQNRTEQLLLDRLKESVAAGDFGHKKSMTFGVIKFGVRIIKGKVIVQSVKAAVDYFWQNLSDDDYEHVVRVSHAINKDNVGELPANVLKAAGVSLEDAHEEAFVSGVASANKIIEPLLKSKK